MDIETLILISGTTKGLGKSLKEVFSKRNVVSINRKDDTDNNVKLNLSERAIDLSGIDHLINMYDKIIFISNASTITPIQKLLNISELELETSIYTNYINPAKIILRIIKSNKKYLILNITSGAAFTSNIELSAYSASKAAMHRFIDILKQEEMDNPNALFIDNFDPGRMQTDMQMELINQKGININDINLSDSTNVAQEIKKLIGKYI